jgi:hypothetical protein
MLALLGVYLGPAMFFDLTYSPQDHSLLFFLAGLTMGVRRKAVGASPGRLASAAGCDPILSAALPTGATPAIGISACDAASCC